MVHLQLLYWMPDLNNWQHHQQRRQTFSEDDLLLHISKSNNSTLFCFCFHLKYLIYVCHYHNNMTFIFMHTDRKSMDHTPQAPEAKSQSIENNSCSSSISAINHAFIAAFFIFNFRTQNRNDMSKKRIDLHKHNYILMMTSPILSAEYNSYETEKIYSFSLAKNPFYQKYNRWWAWMTPARAIVF